MKKEGKKEEREEKTEMEAKKKKGDDTTKFGARKTVCAHFVRKSRATLQLSLDALGARHSTFTVEAS